MADYNTWEVRSSAFIRASRASCRSPAFLLSRATPVRPAAAHASAKVDQSFVSINADLQPTCHE